MSKTDFVTLQNAALVVIGYQPTTYQRVDSDDRLSVVHNVQILAKTARLFKLPMVGSSVARNSLSGPFIPQVVDALGERASEAA